jgi:hypothetical protein
MIDGMTFHALTVFLALQGRQLIIVFSRVKADCFCVGLDSGIAVEEEVRRVWRRGPAEDMKVVEEDEAVEETGGMAKVGMISEMELTVKVLLF